MAVNKNFVVKNGLEVNSQLIFADATNNKVGIASTQPSVELDVRGGIAATNTTVSGVSTIQTGLRVGAGIAGTIFTALDSNVVGVGTSIPVFLLDVRDPTNGGIGTVFNVLGDSLLDHTTVDSLRVLGISTYDDYAHFKDGLDVTAGISTLRRVNVIGLSTFRDYVDIAADVGITSTLVVGAGLSVSGISTLSSLNVIPTSTSIAGLFSGTTSGDMVRITQTGTGNALVVEDSANPDQTAFVIDDGGKIGVGTDSPNGHGLSLYDSSLQLTTSTEGGTFFSGLTFSYQSVFDSYFISSFFKPLNITGGSDLILQNNANKVGIGTTNPEAKLHVSGGDLYVNSLDNTEVDIKLGIHSTHSNFGVIKNVRSSDSQNFLSFNIHNGSLYEALRVHFSEGVHVKGNGNYNTTAYTGNVAHVLFGDQGRKFADIVAESESASSALGALVFKTKGSLLLPQERLRITSDGDVGIGTTQPTAKLTVAGDINLTSGIITATSGIVTYYGDGQFLTNIQSGVGIATTNPSTGYSEIVGLGVTIITFAGPGVSTDATHNGGTGVTVNPASGIATVYLAGVGSGGGGGGGFETQPIWRNDGVGGGTGGIYTFTSVGVGTSAQTSFFEVYGPSKFRTGVVTFTNSSDTDIVRITDGGFNVISGITTIGGALDCNGNLDVDGTDHDIVGTIALDNVQVSAGATIEGNLTLTGAGSTSSIAGALQLTNVNVSGVHTSGFAVVTNDLTVNGNMIVNGTTTTLDSVVQEVDLMNIQANSSTPGLGVTQSGSGPILAAYDDTSEVFRIVDGGNVNIGGNYTQTTYTSQITGTLNVTNKITQNGADVATTGKAIAMAMVFG